MSYLDAYRNASLRRGGELASPPRCARVVRFYWEDRDRPDRGWENYRSRWLRAPFAEWMLRTSVVLGSVTTAVALRGGWEFPLWFGLGVASMVLTSFSWMRGRRRAKAAAGSAAYTPLPAPPPTPTG
jgi:hypothetical protein